MPSRDIYPRLDELRAVIHELQTEPGAPGKFDRLTQAFSNLDNAIHSCFSNGDDFGQRLEAELARLLAPLNERLNQHS